MENEFFSKPILNGPYEYPSRHWELDNKGQPTHQIIRQRRRAKFITPIPNPNDWLVTPGTARLLLHWRHHLFNDVRPFFCQIEAVETAIWLTEVAPKRGKTGSKFLNHLDAANQNANPELMGLALKLATGAGKTTVMAMIIAWQTVNAVRRPNNKNFSRGFLIVTPGITILDRLRVLQANDPDSCYQSRELIPNDMIGDIERAKIVITNYHAFKMRERLELTKGGRLLLQGRGGNPLNMLETEASLCHINWVILDSDWEAEFCRVTEKHPLVKAYVKIHSLGLEAPYRYGSETRIYRPDFIVQVKDGHGDDDLLNLIVEIKGYRRENAKDKKSTMGTNWVPGVNNLKQYGCWAFAKFTEVYQIELDFANKVEAEFEKMLAGVCADAI